MFPEWKNYVCSALVVMCNVFRKYYCKEEITNFQWDSDKFYDSVVGIKVHGEPCCAGVLIATYVVVTSANPYGRYAFDKLYGNPNKRLEINVIDGGPKNVTTLPIDTITGNQYNRNHERWVNVGFDHRHTTIHDIIFITLRDTQNVSYWDWWSERHGNPDNRRFPKANFLEPVAVVYSPTGWRYAGFGFTDKDHLRKSLKLFVVDHGNDEDVLADCEEWLPRPWGHFICLNNIHSYPGILSGAPLFNGLDLYGIGAFEVTKGNESILVFTDLIKYFSNPPLNIRGDFTTSTLPPTVEPV